jgi:type IV pilus assembly protein PilB
LSEALETGAIVELLREEGVLSQEQIGFAERIRAKLTEERPLLSILKELKHVDDQQVRAALQRRRLDVPLGSLLVELGFLDPQDLRVALDLQSQDPSGKAKLGEVLIEHHFVDERKLTELLASQLGFEILEPKLGDLDKKLLARTNASWMLQHEFVPIRSEGDAVVVAFADPMNTSHTQGAEGAFGARVIPAISPRSSILALISRLDTKTQPGGPVDEASVTDIVNGILASAIVEAASDIHIEPLSDRLRVRFRKDGVLVLHKEYRQELLKPLSNRLKVMCEADIAERRRHQDARLFYTMGDSEIDMRVSIYVTIHGEKFVLRLLNRSREVAAISEIGMAPHVLDRFLFDALERPSGVILITGPTGSGKTSTLYSCVHHINHPETSIITAEDPVEYVIDGIGQCSVDPSLDRGFDSTLKQIVRQDPDVIVIGEIRDAFSAGTAIQAALTGHKVLTTFHTEDSIGGLVRLLNMDIEAFLVSSTVVSVLAQRLLRRVCEGCATPARLTPNDLRRLGYAGNELDGAEMKIGRGCDACRHTGYRGRLPIFELLVMDPQLRDAILNRKTAFEIRRLARESSGMLSLLEDAMSLSS